MPIAHTHGIRIPTLSVRCAKGTLALYTHSERLLRLTSLRHVPKTSVPHNAPLRRGKTCIEIVSNKRTTIRLHA